MAPTAGLVRFKPDLYAEHIRNSQQSFSTRMKIAGNGVLFIRCLDRKHCVVAIELERGLARADEIYRAETKNLNLEAYISMGLTIAGIGVMVSPMFAAAVFHVTYVTQLVAGGISSFIISGSAYLDCKARSKKMEICNIRLESLKELFQKEVDFVVENTPKLTKRIEELEKNLAKPERIEQNSETFEIDFNQKNTCLTIRRLFLLTIIGVISIYYTIVKPYYPGELVTDFFGGLSKASAAALLMGASISAVGYIAIKRSLPEVASVPNQLLSIQSAPSEVLPISKEILTHELQQLQALKSHFYRVLKVKDEIEEKYKNEERRVLAEIEEASARALDELLRGSKLEINRNDGQARHNEERQRREAVRASFTASVHRSAAATGYSWAFRNNTIATNRMYQQRSYNKY